GEQGSGMEATLEAWFRFLVDPEPYAELVQGPCAPEFGSGECVEERGVDTTIIEQRKAFLRPDSVVVVIVLSAEYDCSWRSDPTGWELLDGSFVPKRGTSICESAPDDPCCVPCGSELEAGCSEDPACADPYVHEG